MPITDAALRNAKGGIKPYKISDGGGLHLLVRPDGARYWRLAYRFTAKQKTLAIGVYPTVTLAEARRTRDEAKKQLAAGIDPGETKKRAKRAAKLSAENTFEPIAREFVSKQGNRWSVKHAQNYLRRLEIDIFPALGKRPIADIDAPELLDVLRNIEARGAFDLAHRLLQRSSQIFRYGISTGRCSRDPAADLRGALTPHVQRNMPAVKTEEMPNLLAKIDAYDGEPQTQLGLKMLALTFVRTTELIGAEWNEFNIDNQMWVIPAARMKMVWGKSTIKIDNDHRVPLAHQTIEILDKLRILNSHSRFVFVGRNDRTHMSNNTLLYALYRLGYRRRMCGHGFRAVASTILNEQSPFDKDVIERQLAHKERNRTRTAYDRSEHVQKRRELMQWYADHLDQLRIDFPRQ
jgi:integrase